MTKKAELKTLLAEKYNLQEEDIDDTTPITQIVGGDKNLGSHLKDKFGEQPSITEEGDFTTFNDVVTWVDKQKAE
ncbi:MAG TPA: hypothetical protein DCE25_01500 [Pseudomonas sp.]|nr:hypothetical protein [Pseudomonas sp.]